MRREMQPGAAGVNNQIDATTNQVGFPDTNGSPIHHVPEVVAAVLKAAEGRKNWPVSIGSLTQIGTKTQRAFGEKYWWVVNDLAEGLHTQGLFRFSPIPHRDQNFNFSYANGVTRESLEAFLYVYDEVVRDIPEEFQGRWSAAHSQYIDSLPFAEPAQKAKLAMGDKPAAEHILVEVPEVLRSSVVLKQNVSEMVNGHMVASAELDLESTIVDAAFAEKVWETSGVFTSSRADGLILQRDLRSVILRLYPDTTYRELESFVISLISLRKQFPPVLGEGKQKYLTPGQVAAICSVFTVYREDKSPHRRFDRATEKARTLWQEGSAVWQLLDPSVRPARSEYVSPSRIPGEEPDELKALPVGGTGGETVPIAVVGFEASGEGAVADPARAIAESDEILRGLAAMEQVDGADLHDQSDSEMATQIEVTDIAVSGTVVNVKETNTGTVFRSSHARTVRVHPRTANLEMSSKVNQTDDRDAEMHHPAVEVANENGVKASGITITSEMTGQLRQIPFYSQGAPEAGSVVSDVMESRQVVDDSRSESGSEDSAIINSVNPDTDKESMETQELPDTVTEVKSTNVGTVFDSGRARTIKVKSRQIPTEDPHAGKTQSLDAVEAWLKQKIESLGGYVPEITPRQTQVEPEKMPPMRASSSRSWDTSGTEREGKQEIVERRRRDFTLSRDAQRRVHELQDEHELQGVGDLNIPAELSSLLRLSNLTELRGLVRKLDGRVDRKEDPLIDYKHDIDYVSAITVQYIAFMDILVITRKEARPSQFPLRVNVHSNTFRPYAKRVVQMMEWIARDRQLQPEEVNLNMLYQAVHKLNGV